MSIDTLLEAARYLEWQAQQQQITREEDERRQKTVLSRGAEPKRSGIVATSIQPAQANHTIWADEARIEPHNHQPRPPAPPPAPAPVPALHPPMPIAVIPIPVVSANSATSALHTASPIPVVTSLATALSPPGAPLLNHVVKDIHSPSQQQHQHFQHLQHRPLIPHVKAEGSNLPQSGTSPKQQPQALLQPYPAPVITPQHALLAQPALTQPQNHVSQPGRPNGATLEDTRGLEGKRRPGGAGTREVHNKLEKNRRAHLKECFETLKRNVPNVDEKKTSNLSVLRSALRYIQTLKRKEKEYEHEMEKLAREKIATQQRLAELKNDLSQCMDIMEIDRIVRQTVQPEDDQASTSTASEGEDNFEQDAEDGAPPSSRSSILGCHPALSEQRAPVLPPPPSILQSHIAFQHKPTNPPQPQSTAIAPQPSVIAHASVSHASVIQAVNHVLPAASKPIGHITVHPVTLYPQTVAVSQPQVLGHITQTLAHHPQSHSHVNGAAVGQQGTMVGKPTAVVAHHHAGLVGQAVLNPVTMVTVPPFPVSTLKLA
ncbi:MAX network transcriptional repressor b isoform X1 [Tachysurus fulvidraco]|uniref:MAX network transcriptional repressor b isoform X1 n=1 Tax=Tachysurus fulvidraco TaxID=1234273 RepID=UPI000F4F8B68|nr:MAX network transcriptional repressor b isoform X1 [Tachysurus fulvidraco]